MPKIVLVAVAAAALLGVAATSLAQNNMSFKTAGGETQRTMSKTDIKASPEAVFAMVDDVHSWSKWAWPYDPPAKRTYSGAAKGKGAIYEWEEAGSGRALFGRAPA